MQQSTIGAKLRKLLYIFRHYSTVPFYGFVQGHDALSEEQVADIGRLVCTSAPAVIIEFETTFASLVGEGHAVSFAAARMAFFALMKSLGIGAGDEVILPAATCAVMANAVLRLGATPIFSDIDPETFGSSAQAIKDRLTPRTRMIIAQHSFGIPCDIQPIVALARSNGIFLLEDCALTVGSKADGITVGNFGDAALFSTDRTKPINAMIGGVLFTKDSSMAAKLREIQAAAGDLPDWKQRALWERFLFERKFCNPARNGGMALHDVITRVTSPTSKRPFLDQDFGIVAGNLYPYPAQMPAFLAALGIIEVRRWTETAMERQKLLRGLLAVTDGSDISKNISKVYRDRRFDIVPLRLAWAQDDGAAMRDRLSNFTDVSWTWFMQPIVGTVGSMEDYGYYAGSCPASERIGPDMVNLPCNVSAEFAEPLVDRFKAAIFR
jgi:perosamine synthetase